MPFQSCGPSELLTVGVMLISYIMAYAHNLYTSE